MSFRESPGIPLHRLTDWINYQINFAYSIPNRSFSRAYIIYKQQKKSRKLGCKIKFPSSSGRVLWWPKKYIPLPPVFLAPKINRPYQVMQRCQSSTNCRFRVRWCAIWPPSSPSWCHTINNASAIIKIDVDWNFNNEFI